jgi:pantoate--beta-alanine ligase
MGALHAGHLSLIDAARDDGGLVVVSIFVNPTQFGPTEDLAKYPRTPEADLAACETHGVDLVFMPQAATMYAGGGLTEVTVKELSATLCGRSRPGHFPGVCTVVAKLFNIIQPDRAYFGAKDYQQAVIIRRMAADLNFPVEVKVCPTVREADGLAMSSRNAYLDADQRNQAVALIESLRLGEGMIRCSRPPADEVITAMRNHVASRAPAGEIDYVQVVDPQTLQDVAATDQPVLLALAVRIGKARLIDNMLVDARAGET